MVFGLDGWVMIIWTCLTGVSSATLLPYGRGLHTLSVEGAWRMLRRDQNGVHGRPLLRHLCFVQFHRTRREPDENSRDLGSGQQPDLP